MGVQFNWQIDDIEDEEPSAASPNGPAGRKWWVLLAIVCTLLLGVGGYSLQQRLEESDEELAQAVQILLDQQQQAYLARDGELFFDGFAANPSFRADQLMPHQQEVWRQGLTATKVEQHGRELWVNATWTASYGSTYQRLLFLERQGSTLKHISKSTTFWGPLHSSEYPWGELVLYDADVVWEERFASFVDEVVTEACATSSCKQFTLIVANDFATTAEPSQLRVPSPRIFALDEQGEPADLFWFTLRNELAAFLTPSTIRFAAPATQQSIYNELAKLYMERFPNRKVEIVNLNDLPNDPAKILAAVDGATITPASFRQVSIDLVPLPMSESLLASGLIYDLTDFANTDPNFDQADFYEQIWLGAWWQGRMWMVPQAADLQLIYYERDLYGIEDRPYPSLRWTWDELEQEMSVLEKYDRVGWGIIGNSPDMLFSYAYNLGNDCDEDIVTVHCNRNLGKQEIAAALSWYQAMVQEGHTPDLTQLTADERVRLMQVATSPSSTERAALWIDEPIEFDNYAVQRSASVAPFPGSDRFDGVTPLWVYGNVISQASERPRATWHWLTFLSYQYPERTGRLIPARPSVAKASNYWDSLPNGLRDAMRTAFPFTRPVRIEEQGYFSNEQIAAVLTNKLTPTQAVDIKPPILWFIE